ncbi:MAG TPA: metal-sensitive transcriptional regulator, partial [Actinomycetes bacterium]|nr:metal-sensitive transcriptional regulator [Actinomycetes bacterium]
MRHTAAYPWGAYPEVETTHPAGGTAVTGYVQNKDAVLRRLRRIEGQVRGLQRMVDDEAYC